MFSKAVVATLFGASVIASPTSLFKRGPDACGTTFTDDSGAVTGCYMADIRYFTDENCQNAASPPANCEYGPSGIYDFSNCDAQPASGSYACSGGPLPQEGPYYAMMGDGVDPNTQVSRY
jgi:hypothetical protein